MPIQPDDWYTVTMTDLKEVGFPYYLGKLKLAQLLSQKYPEHKWEKVLLLKGRFAPQRRLERTVASLFPVSFHYPPPPPKGPSQTLSFFIWFSNPSGTQNFF